MIKRRGRGRRSGLAAKDSDDEEFTPHRTTKKIKADSDGSDIKVAHEEPKIKKKTRSSNTAEDKQKLDQQSVEQAIRSIKYTFERPNINKLFEEVINSANDEMIMSILKQVLSAGYKAMSEKRYNLKKRWLALKNSNSSEQEYRQKEKELKVAEVDEINEIREEIYNKLCAAKIIGFQTKEQLLDRIFQDLVKRLADKKIENPAVLEEIQEREYKQYKQHLFELIDRLLSEKAFTEDSRKIRYQRTHRGRGGYDAFDGDGDGEGQRGGYGGADSMMQNQGREIVSLSKYFGVSRNKSNPQLRQQAMPVLQAKADLLLGLKGKTVEDLARFTDEDKNLMKKYEFQTLTDSANEKLIIDEQFLKNQRNQFSQKMQELYKNGPYKTSDLSDETFKEMMLVINYIINSIHNVNKNEQYDLLIHPNDLLSLLDRFK